ncbi:unnamed protein product [Urochloa humidicola]
MYSSEIVSELAALEVAVPEVAAPEVVTPEDFAPGIASELDVAPEDVAPKDFAPGIVSELDDVLEDIAPEDVAPELDDALETKELLAPDSFPLSAKITVPDSLPPGAFLCGGCPLVHEDREAWNRAHSRLYPCARCGLIHSDYWLSSPLRRDDFDCSAAMDVKRKREEGEVEWRKRNSK